MSGRASAAAGSTRRRRALLEARAKRVRPGLDDKRLTSWNALVIAALAEAGAVLERDDYLEAARACADFVLDELRDARGPPAAHLQGRRGPPQRLPRGPRLPARGAADPLRSDLRAALVRGAPASSPTTMIARFGDPERGGFFSTSADHEALIARRKEIGDHPIPSGQLGGGDRPAAARGAQRRARLRAPGRGRLPPLRRRRRTRHPDAFAHLLRALDFHLSPTREVALVGDDLGALAAVVRSELRPHLVLAGGPEGAELAGAARGRTDDRRAAPPPTSASTSAARRR